MSESRHREHRDPPVILSGADREGSQHARRMRNLRSFALFGAQDDGRSLRSVVIMLATALPLHGRFRFAGELAPLFGFALVVELLSSDDGNLGLHLSAFEVEA